MLCGLQIGIIREVHEPVVGPDGESTQNVTVNWYYRPNEVVGGRKVSSGNKVCRMGARLGALCREGLVEAAASVIGSFCALGAWAHAA